MQIRKFSITLAFDFGEYVLAFLSSDGITQVGDIRLLDHSTFSLIGVSAVPLGVNFGGAASQTLRPRSQFRSIPAQVCNLAEQSQAIHKKGRSRGYQERRRCLPWNRNVHRQRTVCASW